VLMLSYREGSGLCSKRISMLLGPNSTVCATCNAQLQLWPSLVGSGWWPCDKLITSFATSMGFVTVRAPVYVGLDPTSSCGDYPLAVVASLSSFLDSLHVCTQQRLLYKCFQYCMICVWIVTVAGSEAQHDVDCLLHICRY